MFSSRTELPLWGERGGGGGDPAQGGVAAHADQGVEERRGHGAASDRDPDRAEQRAGLDPQLFDQRPQRSQQPSLGGIGEKPERKSRSNWHRVQLQPSVRQYSQIVKGV